MLHALVHRFHVIYEILFYGEIFDAVRALMSRSISVYDLDVSSHNSPLFKRFSATLKGAGENAIGVHLQIVFL